MTDVSVAKPIAAFSSDLEATLSEVGYAKVIVALKPALSAATAESAEVSLSAYFAAPDRPEAAGLALAASNFASRDFRRKKPIAQRAVRIFPRLGLAIGFVHRKGAEGLAADQRVGDVVPAPELSLIKPVEATAAKAPASATWGIKRLNVTKLWDAGITGRDVVVGHLDTGIDGARPALSKAIAAFAEFDLAGDQVPNAQAWDSGNHGTHTAGTIAGRPTGKGAFGVAPEAKLASAMVIEGGQVIDRILSGMEWILEHNARILSMSLGLRGYTPAFQLIIDALRNQNVLPVIAIGNEGPLTSRSPGNYANVLSVGASDSQDTVAYFSSSQTFARPADPLVPDLVAPGVDVLSCVPGNGYANMNGSSMATPHIAGLAALLLQAKPSATVDELEAAIIASCQRPNTMPEVRANRGVPDAVAAYTALVGQPPMAVAVFASKPTARRKKPSKRMARKKIEAKAARKTRRRPKKVSIGPRKGKWARKGQ